MRTFLVSLAGFLLLIISVTVCAEMVYFDGNGLKQRLADTKDNIPRTMAMGYIVGVYDTASGVAICGPEEANAGELVAVVEKYLAEHPEQLHTKASDIVIKALSTVFPCRK